MVIFPSSDHLFRFCFWTLCSVPPSLISAHFAQSLVSLSAQPLHTDTSVDQTPRSFIPTFPWDVAFSCILVTHSLAVSHSSHILTQDRLCTPWKPQLPTVKLGQINRHIDFRGEVFSKYVTSQSGNHWNPPSNNNNQSLTPQNSSIASLYGNQLIPSSLLYLEKICTLIALL